MKRVKGAYKALRGKRSKAILQNPMRAEIRTKELPGKNPSASAKPVVLKQRGRGEEM